MKRFIALALIGVSGLAAIGCQQSQSRMVPPANIAVRPSATNVKVGETVTLVTRTENLLGEEARIDWDATGGRITTEENGRVARVVFDRPGTYTVDTKLMVDGEEVQRETTLIEVANLEVSPVP